jgi:SIR2-like domain
MALFVLGAGATRGAEFVNPVENPCLPPLDVDFYAQLQRIANPKHQDTVRDVIKDTVELFGNNFQVSMEMVFTTLEHTARMVDTTGENKEFNRNALEKKRQSLKQAIAATLEESMCGGQRVGKKCKYHQVLVKTMKAEDSIITFNYDCLIDETLRECGSGIWNPRYGYGLNLGKGRRNLVGHENWQPKEPATKDKTVSLYKLHGSLHFWVQGKEGEEKVSLKNRPYTKQNRNQRFTIIPPESDKRYDRGVFKRIWQQAARTLHGARHLVIIGYSFPVTDSHSNALFRISVGRDKLESLVLVNPDREARRRAREVLKRGLSSKTKVIVFDKLSEFASASRELWDPGAAAVKKPKKSNPSKGSEG